MDRTLAGFVSIADVVREVLRDLEGELLADSLRKDLFGPVGQVHVGAWAMTIRLVSKWREVSIARTFSTSS